MASKELQRFLVNKMMEASEKRREQARAQKIADMVPQLIGQQAQDAQEQITSPYQQGPQEMFPGEQPTKGLMDIDQQAQPAQPATGLFDMDKSAPERNIAFNQRMAASGMPSLQKRAFDNLSKMKGGSSESGLSEVQSSKILPGGLVQIVRKDGTTDIIPPEEAGGKLVKQAEDRGAELQGLRSREREGGKRAIMKSNKLLQSTSKMRRNNVNLRKAVQFLQEGAQTGPVTKMLPSLRASSVKLQNLQAQLGLDVVGSVTFGALSKGELDLAKSVALPTGLQPLELKKWVEAKIEAQEKLATYLEDQAIFLDSGGTPASWIQKQRDDKELRQQSDQGQSGQNIDELLKKYGN